MTDKLSIERGQDMTMERYVDDCHVTVARQAFPKKVSAPDFILALNDFKEAGERLDSIKKSLFYGKGDDVEEGMEIDDDIVAPNLDWNTIHAIIGVASEAGELVEALLDGLNNREFDNVNLKEETGDSFWYYAILSRAAGFTFKEAMETNIRKLKKRFPDNEFSLLHSENRDLESEREILANKS